MVGAACPSCSLVAVAGGVAKGQVEVDSVGEAGDEAGHLERLAQDPGQGKLVDLP
jgi:hypothetical protein